MQAVNSTQVNTDRTEQSEFSDDEYLQELEEERVALRLVQQLQEWLPVDNRTSQLKAELSKHSFSSNAFASTLVQIGFPLARMMDASILLKYIYGGVKSTQEQVQVGQLVDSLTH